MKGVVHSIESFGTVNGPRVRMVIFLKGCPMRCLYCHNPDTWEMAGGIVMEPEEIIQKFEDSRHFYSNGGITVTGGEPLMQIDFVTEIFEIAKEHSIHTCLDTSGISFLPDNPKKMQKMDKLISVTNLVLLDIKHIDSTKHQELCGQPLEGILQFAHYLDWKQIPVWIRHVVVPGLTDQETDLYKLGQFIGELHNVQALDVLPYHDMGKNKYQKLGLDYPLKNIQPLSKEAAIEAKKIIIQGIRDTREAASRKYSVSV